MANCTKRIPFFLIAVTTVAGVVATGLASGPAGQEAAPTFGITIPLDTAIYVDVDFRLY